MHFNVKNVLQLDEALHELPIHDSGITSIENVVGNKELSIHLSNLYENKKMNWFLVVLTFLKLQSAEIMIKVTM